MSNIVLLSLSVNYFLELSIIDLRNVKSLTISETIICKF